MRRSPGILPRACMCLAGEAAGGGHLSVLQWLRANGCDWNEFTCWGAARIEEGAAAVTPRIALFIPGIPMNGRRRQARVMAPPSS